MLQQPEIVFVKYKCFLFSEYLTEFALHKTQSFMCTILHSDVRSLNIQ